jgi:hypothetical protein
VNDKSDKALVKSLVENTESLNLAFQLSGEAESCSIEITAEAILQGNILLFARQNCLVSQKNLWDTLRGYSSYDEKNGNLLLLQLSKEVLGDPLQLQEILQDFFRLSSQYEQLESTNKFNSEFLDHEESSQLHKEELKQQQVKITDFHECYEKLLAQFHVKEAEAKVNLHSTQKMI